MISKFKVNRWYRFTGKGIRNRNPSGEMDFMLDGQPHRCAAINKDKDTFAAFDDSPAPNHLWNWAGNMTYLEEVRKGK